MSDSRKRLLFFLMSVAALLIFSVAAYAECDTECDPRTSSCSQECDVCRRWGIDGCIGWRASTCGDSAGGCIPDTCTPNFYYSTPLLQGTYDGRSPTGCTHHSVYKITVTDLNSCNTNPYYYSWWYCDDEIDGTRGGFYPSCCDSEPTPLFTCDGNHSCY